MKKRNLYKLIKEQLRITLKEELFKKRTKKRNDKLWDKKWKNFINEQKIIKKQQDKEHFLRIARFLKESKKSKILLEEIIENPLLSNINKKKLPKLYKSLNSLSFSKLVEQIADDEFAPEVLTTWGGDGGNNQWDGCNMSQTDFGTATIYDSSVGGCSSTPHIIDDSFVCCSDNNTYTQNWSGYGTVDPFQLGTQQNFTGLAAGNMGAITNSPGATSACYCPNPVVDSNNKLTSCFTNTTTYNITVADFGNFLTNFGISNINLNTFGGFNGASCAGCSHMASPAVAGTTPSYGMNPWNNTIAGGTGGCPTDGSNLSGGVGQAGWNGQMSPDNLSCCTFYGCDQSLAVPAPTTLATFALGGNLGTITANATDDWFIDGLPGVPCEFMGCPPTGTSFTLGGTTYDYNVSNASTFTTAPINTNNLPYLFTNDGSCVMTACSDSNITTVTDPQGNTLANNYIANPTTAPYPYTVTNDVTECIIQACNTAGSVNTVDTSQTGWNSSWTIVDTTPSMCNAVVTGCTNSTQGAPNYADTTGTCPDGTTGIVNPGTTVDECITGTSTVGYVAQNYNPAANTNQGCTYLTATINGCTNPLATNYYCITNYANVGYECTDDGSGATAPANLTVLPVDATSGAQLVVDTSPTSMCTYTAGCVDKGGDGTSTSIMSNTYIHNQPAATFPATLPNSTTSSPYGGNAMNLNIIESALNFSPAAFAGGESMEDNSCTYNPGCTDDDYIEFYNIIPPAIHDDGTCDTLKAGNMGCTLGQNLGVQGLNTDYDDFQFLDDGTCDIEACDDPAADNYVCGLVDSVPLSDFCPGYDPLNPTNPLITINEVPQANAVLGVKSVNSFTPAGIYDPNGINGPANNKFLACKYTFEGCTVPGAVNYDPTANTPDQTDPCYFNYCDDTAAFNYSVNQPTSQYETAIIAYTSNTLNTVDNSICEYIGCSTPTIGTTTITTATVGTLGMDDGYDSGNDGCVSGSAAGTTAIPSTTALGHEATGLLDPLNTDCCEFAGCYNAGNPTYNQVVGGMTTTAVPMGYNPDANVDNGDCKYFGCTDQNASNYFCIANPDVCGGSQGGVVDPLIGYLADDGTCEYDHCADIQAVKCGGPYSNPGGGQQIVYDFDCVTIGGAIPVLGTNDHFKIQNPPDPQYPDPDMPGLAEQINKMVDIPNPGSTCYEVVVVNPSNSGNQTDYPSCVCPPPTFPDTWDCCTYSTCPGTFQLHYGPNSDWGLANPGVPTPSVNAFAKFCQLRTDGTGQFSTLPDCHLDCDEAYYNCTCCLNASGQPQSPTTQVNDPMGGCSTLNSTVYSHCQPAVPPTNPPPSWWPNILEVCKAMDIIGCTDPLASNYNQYVTVDDGSCEYEGADCQCCVFVEDTITLSPITITSWCIGYYGYPFGTSTSPPCPYVLGQQVTSQFFEHQNFSANPTCEDNNTVTAGTGPYSVGDITMCTQHPSQGGWTWDCSNDIIPGLPKIVPTDGEIGIDKDLEKGFDDEFVTKTPEDTPEDNSEIKESKKLRKLIKKWRRNNL